jgi:signal transduction histidine kinase
VSDGGPVWPWTLRRRIGQSFIVLGALLVLLVTVLTFATVKFVTAGNRVVYRWEPAVADSRQLSTDLVDQLAAVRGYALDSRSTAAADYQAYRSAERSDVAELRDKVKSNPHLLTLIDEFAAAARSWQHAVADPAFAQTSDHAAVVRAAVADELFAPVRRTADAIADGVQKEADAARHDRTAYGTLFVIAFLLTSVVLIAIGFAIWRGLHRWVLEPVDQLGSQTREVARGDTYMQIRPEGPLEFAALGRDVEAMRLQIAGQLVRSEEIQEELRVRSDELARSNDDLQQFAYVASHDLSEPLRKVANFCQLLERQYGDQLDDRARQYIDFAVDGAKRMQVLIADLLALSRVGRTTDEFVPVSLDEVLDLALGNLGDRLSDANAQVIRESELPTVLGDKSLLTSLFENLVGNAVKYRRADVPAVVRVSATPDPDTRMWTITVRDNGIGIAAEYAERIFVVFQRLHVRDEYGGTGIGLALCRKIVEFHGGRIWLDTVESSEGTAFGHGATFRFTIPEGGVIAESRD